ncbi:MAG: NAD(P)H-hydrate dehydratase [Gammaproteobacteria bacterium]|nr:NAD(P)H-hydrate dehydratase [Gammaproteobacteria bacterium]
MIAISHRLYTAAQVRQLDRYAIEQEGMPGYELMQRAGNRAFRELLAAWPDTEQVLICCGPGNNGGDGYVVARLALEACLRVQLIQLGDSGRIKGEAAQARKDFLEAGGEELAWDGTLPEANVIVDALLGTGIEREVEGDYLNCIQAINNHDASVVSLDIPSGLNADTGAPMGEAVSAELTVSFVGQKQGLHTGIALEYRGRLSFDDLGVPPSAYASVKTQVSLSPTNICFEPRPLNSHKGMFGHVVIVGGGQGMPGAAIMAGKSALRTGAGRVSILTTPEHAALIPVHCPELMAHGVEQAADARPVLEQASCLVIGPGLGLGDWARRLFDVALEYPVPTVLDADALTLLAASSRKGGQWIITPHPGEAGRLLNKDSRAIQADRFSAGASLQERFNATVVLKGAGTMVVSAEGVEVCPAGNPGMATAGMGDILSGVIGALMGQGLSLDEAASHGVCIHASAADRAALQGERGLMATDLLEYIRDAMNR